MKGQAISYSTDELAWIKANCKRPRRAAHADFQERFGRQDISLTNFNALCKRNGWMTGRTGQFKQGQISHNKGRKGYCAPGCEKGWFKPGERRGVAVKLYKPIGSERMSKDGYLERKIHDGMPLQLRWRAVHLIRWEEINGPLPEGHALKCLDGDRTNTDPSNWEAIPRAMLPRLAGRWRLGYDEAPAKLKPTVMAIAKLEHKARELKRSAKEKRDE